MTRPSKWKTKVKKQEQDNKRKFSKKLKLVDELKLIDEFDEWEDDDDSGWNDDVSLLNENEPFKLAWSDNTCFKKKKRGPYLVGKIKKSIYFDKYGPSGSFTKVAKGTANILTLINKHQLTPIDFEEVLDDAEDEEQNLLNLNEKINILKIELKEQQKLLTVAEYNKKRAILEYLTRLNDNEKGKMKVSMKATQLVFIKSGPYKARSIRYWTNY